jgi:ribonuclease P protein component
LAGAAAPYPRDYRLLGSSQYQRVFRHCEAKAGDRLMTVLAASNELPHPRLGTAVSIKAAGNAVKRNRIKRLIRESFRLHRELLGSIDLVVLVRPGISALSNQQLLSALDTHWRTIAAHAHTRSDTH